MKWKLKFFHFFSIILISFIKSQNSVKPNNTAANNTKSTTNYYMKIETCAPTPAIPRDCFSFDNETNSCCFYSYIDTSGCVWLGSRYIGETDYGALHFQCPAYLQELNIFFLICLIIFLL